jgi:dTDP-4-dehydrorhamnose reductase
MIGLMRTKPSLRVVADQVAAPTWASGLARALWACALNPQIHGILHWRDAGTASWYDFAVAIQEEALALGILNQPIPVIPIATKDYPTPATRPAFSLLDCDDSWQKIGQQPPHWRVNLRTMLSEWKKIHG